MRTQTMVARVVLPPGRPGSVGAGYANTARATTPSLASLLVAVFLSPMEMTDMENISHNTDSEAVTSTLSLYRELFNRIDLQELTSSQLLDLAALSAEQAEGLCNGLILFNELLQKNSGLNALNWEHVNGYLNATAHLLPVLCNLHGRALREMEFHEVMK